MNLFKRKKQPELTDSQKKFNKLWDMYASGDLESSAPGIYALCDYEGGVNGEGHSGWFFNTENSYGTEALQALILSLKEILPDDLYDNLNTAFKSYGTEDEEAVCEKADEYYYNSEHRINDILQNYADTLTL